MAPDISLSLSTTIEPAKKFLVDGDEYQLLGVDHLSSEDENEVAALFARHNLLTTELAGTLNVLKGKSLAERIKATRLQLLTKLTDLPKSVAEKLPLGQQTKLLEALQAEMQVENDDDGIVKDEDADPPEAPGGASTSD